MSRQRITEAIRTQIPRTEEGEHSSPLYLTSSFTFEDAESMRAAFADESDANIYSRFSNPSVQEFSDRMCVLEGAESGFATASGMSAVFATFAALLQSGDHLLCCASVFGSTRTVVSKYLPRFGIEATYVSTDPADWTAALQPGSRMVYLETPTNPGLQLVDMEAAARFCKAHGLLLVVDNCFATPVCQRPLEWGADLVVHSATKWIDGQGRVLGGCVLGPKHLIHDIYLFCRSTGPSLSPFNAWVLSRSIETLEVRMQRHAQTALHLAQSLEGHPALNYVRYPHLPSHPQYEIARRQMQDGGGLVAFELKGGVEAGRRFLDALQLLSRTANLGDTRSIASHPASTTHAKMSEAERLQVEITPGLIRISCGLEAPEDILADVVQALAAIGF